MSSDLQLVAKARALTGDQVEAYEMVGTLADALEAATWRYAELLVAGKPQRQANRRRNAGIN